MPLQPGKLKSGKSVEVTFTADGGNGGSSAVVVGHVPTGGSTPTIWLVPEGTSQSRTITVKKAKLLRIDVDVPNGGKGALVVKQGDRTWSKPPVSKDAIWTFEIA